MINRRFFNFKTYNGFLAMKDQIPEDAIVFIQEKTCIWAHGKEYFCSDSQNADVTPVVNVPDTATIANNALTFSNGTDTIVFTVSQRNGTITLTDSNGNTSSATYILKTQFDRVINTIDTESASRDDDLQRQINTKADKSAVDLLDSWKDSFSEYVINITENQPFKSELKPVAFSGSYEDLDDKPTIPTVDSELSNTSTNPVQNKAITRELDRMINSDILSNYVLTSTYTAGLNAKQDILSAGYGIQIEQNTISTTLDTSIYEIVTELPTVQNANPNKIYLLEVQNADGTFRYEQYRLRNGQWVSFDAVMPTVNLSPYLSKTEATLLYQRIGDYLTSADLIPYAKLTDISTIRESLNDYIQLSYAENRYQRKGDYATNDYVNSTFVKKTDVYTPKQDTSIGQTGTTPSSGTGTEQPTIIINQGNDITVDTTIDLTSSNPVENRAIAIALGKKANASDLQNYALASDLDSKLGVNALDNYVTNTRLTQQLDTKQDVLSAGDGISIIDNVISSTIDTNMWVIVDELPSTNINPNKIYLVEDVVDGETIYIEWRYKDGQWVRNGQRTPEIDLSGYQRVGDYATNDQVANTYLTKEDAASTYQPVGNYADVTDVANTYQEKGDFVEYSDLDAFRITLENTYQKRGAYALASDVSQALTVLQNLIDQKYVLKKDVYLPEGGNFSTDTPTQITIGTSNGDGTGSTEPGTHTSSNMITLTTAQYEALVRTNMVDANTYYFTYEETTWGFGDKFPVTLTGGDTSDSIGTFPINLV